MAIKKLFLDKVPSREYSLTVRKSGLAWSAKFIREHNLEYKDYVCFYEDDENPYWLGFDFEEDEQNGCLKLSKNKDSSGVFIKAQQIFSRNSVLRKIQKDQNVNPSNAGKFEIHHDKRKKYYFVNLRPCFENSIPISDINNVPEGLIGIYRYLDKDEIVYIGEGIIRQRVKEKQREDWKADRFEYSILEDKESCERWESYYISEFEVRFGRRPYYNAQSGRKI